MSAPGSRQTQISEPSDCGPEGPTDGSFRGMDANCACTSADNIARQSAGIATGATVGVIVGIGVAVGAAVDSAGGDVGAAEPSPSGAHALSASTAATANNAAPAGRNTRRGMQSP
ncbi:transcriptional regulator [Microbacterium testaceum StLB037]|uniref:Transcriptional regulator n=1 Tax=Microbacterium testaceum (strain StLB037) TaxID=979556 RepID=E8NF81_MICTS|nr:transcriptional regulator [Microbacterium testaceum StLB037]